MPSIFVSYRRKDVPGHAGRLYDRLVDRFGKANVFMDVGSMEPGADFVEAIEETVGRCDALIAVIGPEWLGAVQGGVRRLDDPQDWVRVEIVAALNRKIRLLPVLVHGAAMPSPTDLPEELRQLARRQALHLTETAWDAQVEKLIDDLEDVLQRRPSGHAPWSAGARQVLQIEHPKSGFRGGRPREVRDVAFSPDGRRIATASTDKTARVWEADTGRELTQLKHDDVVGSVAFSLDGKRIATSANKTARIWEADTGRELARITDDEYLHEVAFSLDGKRIAAICAHKTARVWNADSGRELTRVAHDEEVTDLAFSPGGERITTASTDKTARLWDADSGRELTRVAHDDEVWGLAFSPDGERIATTSADKTVRVWEADSGRELTRITSDDYVKDVAFSPDGRLIAASGGDKTTRVWEADSGRELTRITHDDYVGAMAFSPDGKRIAVASRNDGARVWEASPSSRPAVSARPPRAEHTYDSTES